MNSRDIARFEIIENRTKVLRKHRWQVNLIAGNGEIVSVSEQLTSLTAAYRNVDAQKAIVPRAPIVVEKRYRDG